MNNEFEELLYHISKTDTEHAKKISEVSDTALICKKWLNVEFGLDYTVEDLIKLTDIMLKHIYK